MTNTNVFFNEGIKKIRIDKNYNLMYNKTYINTFAVS